jgi:hypothetical protein
VLERRVVQALSLDPAGLAGGGGHPR